MLLDHKDLWGSGGTGLTFTGGDSPGQRDPSQTSTGPSFQASQSKRNAMEEKHTAHNQKVDLKCFQACFYHTETSESYYKELLLEFISFSLENFQNYCFGSQQIYYGGFSPWSYFHVKNAKTRQHK